ncbi:Flavin-dependent oxidoreductase, luciferase family (includes alkanesulfonate monooxygenase SsuD and methylene tetrahydromethanopterin reductase) [Pedococcus dokdonensis]|uniref:Flavin-dependent oxidoreductase, luciferase family (Includes alkanesulfonate monooxygenase SsuD and methylene tetrahydromethanopterin reductase) n=1 Tax=Pedococcus dokdonensis TaxID=443156 RepID=A0A1H0T4P5_9MICO|nr:LLM class flavin-dependent oxidoreductase [Pedococcus dokdonensis]SDP48795.1 Flavin-dependent oxidoreductase, luciferase family (includes alkanesulfonate monooxygenase SsuD and methylene tetrahydromethanopterin reductase) [Pedococcus dokdonensis]
MAPRIGVAFIPTLPPEALRPLARAADEHLDDLWVWEDCFKESGIASAAVALASTERVRVGLGLMPTPLRNVALTAMEVATLQRIFPGRFVPGVGHGVQPWMAQVGGRVESPMTLLEEHLTALRRLLAGEEVTVDGRYVQLDQVKLDWPPQAGELLTAGGFGPRTIELSARLTDAVLISAGQSETELRAAVARARAAAPSGRVDVVYSLVTAAGPDAQARADADLAQWGVAPEPTRVAAGSAQDIAAAIGRAADAGATTVVVQPTADLTDVADVVELVAFVGREVRPLLV